MAADRIAARVQEGWTPEAAQYAARAEKAPLRMTGKELLAIAAGLSGIAIGIACIMLLLKQEMQQALLAAGAIAIGIAVLLWALYELAVKHNHPRLHKIFFLATAMTVGEGVFLWLNAIIILFFLQTQATLYTVAAAAIIATVFVCSTLAMEFMYLSLRERFDAVPPKNHARLIILSVCIGLLCATSLLVAVWQGERIVVREVNIRLEQTHSGMQEYVAQATPMLRMVPDPALKARFEQDIIAAQSAQFTPLKEPLFTEVLYDTVVQTRCEALKANMEPFYQVIGDVRALEPEGPQSATMDQLRSPIRYKSYDDFVACLEDAVGIN